MNFSVIIPAHNEESYIGKCLQSIEAARKQSGHSVEVIVCLNRCTDRTQEIAEQFKAKIVREDERNLSKIRNKAAQAATGDVLVTIDSDSEMSPATFSEIERHLASGSFIGGGTRIWPERLSLGIILSALVIFPVALASGCPSAGLFWCYRKDFEALRGFNESLLTVEDVDFSKRLKAYGKSLGKRYGTIKKAPIKTSCRKFDRFGDWYLFRNPGVLLALFRGTNKKAADKFYYDFKN